MINVIVQLFLKETFNLVSSTETEKKAFNLFFYFISLQKNKKEVNKEGTTKKMKVKNLSNT
jgi:hypothetical protein